jgi:hypothetical protein
MYQNPFYTLYNDFTLLVVHDSFEHAAGQDIFLLIWCCFVKSTNYNLNFPISLDKP